MTIIQVCDIWTSIDVICCTSSILHLVAISMDRYWAVTRVDYIHNRSARRIFTMIALSWVISTIISIPPLMGWKDPEADFEFLGQCIISQSWSYTVFSTMGAFYLPLVFMIVIYLNVYRAARSRIRKKNFRSSLQLMTSPSPSTTSFRARTRARMKHPSELSTSQIAESTASTPCSLFPVTRTPPSEPPASPTSLCMTASTSIMSETITPPPSQLSSVYNFKKPQKDVSSAPITEPAIPSSSTPPSSCPLIESAEIISQNLETSPFIPMLRVVTAAAINGGCTTNGIQENSEEIASPEKSGKRKGQARSSDRKNREKREQTRERKAARTLAIITGSFVICWLPFFILALVRPFCGKSCTIPEYVSSIAVWLGYFNSLLNPVIYTIFNPDFRLAFRKIIFGKYRHQNHHSYRSQFSKQSVTSASYRRQAN